MTKLFGKDNGMFGRSHSESTRLKISASLFGRTLSEENKRNISKALSGRTYKDLYGDREAEQRREVFG